jgi:hypothetical protein
LVSDGWCSTHFEVRFETNAVDLDVSRLKFFDEVVGGGCLAAGRLETVVVVI